jgi:hypothetical protein
MEMQCASQFGMLNVSDSSAVSLDGDRDYG